MGVCCIVISPNEVFCDIMVLASHPPVDPDDVKLNEVYAIVYNKIMHALTLQNKSFKFYMWVDTP